MYLKTCLPNKNIKQKQFFLQNMIYMHLQNVLYIIILTYCHNTLLMTFKQI